MQKSYLLLSLTLVFLFASPFSIALENCADAIRVSYSTSAIIQILGESISPGPSVVRVTSSRELPFVFANGTTNFFYVATADQYYEGQRLAYAGEVFYKDHLERSYFKRSQNSTAFYSENGDYFVAFFDRSYDFEYAGKKFKTDVVRIASSKNLAFSV